MRRRAFLAGGAGAVAVVSAQSLAGCSTTTEVATVEDTAASDEVSRLRQQYLQEFDAEYVDNVIVPFFQNSVIEGQRPVLPMIDVALTKENALPYDMWGLLSDQWGPAPEDGVTVFLQGLEKRGPDNLRKRIYMSAVTPDLYAGAYQAKVTTFFDGLFSPSNADKPLMQTYLDTFWDLYWDLHLGVTGDAIPAEVREIGASFNTVLAYRDPTQKIVHDNYMTVRGHLAFLKQWIDDRLADIESGTIQDADKTFAWFWLKNGEDSEHFNHKDVVFECFHNFVAFSQWGNSLYNIMATLGRDTGDAATKDSFTKTMSGAFDEPDGSAFPPLERFVMELFRVISRMAAASRRWPRPGNRCSNVTTTWPHLTRPPARIRCSGPTPTPSILRVIATRPPAKTSTRHASIRWAWRSARSNPRTSPSRTDAKPRYAAVRSARCSASSTTNPCRCATTQGLRRSGSATVAALVSS
ncbi:hypothetical protein [Mycobacterium sp. MS1601]|uniref:hypothetical protein n=1 Tax=Mycobacterium sp. MS1601 TaxID=1936029 RepID=UPI001F27A9C4|nr:hypothetical protein [Mycobacterium sp. MS1601]